MWARTGAGMAAVLVLLCGRLTVSAQTTVGPGTRLLLPASIVYDTAGNLYIADTNRNQVLEATVGGVLLVVAGTGVQGFSGDGGAASAAQLSGPQGVAFGADGTLYVADTGNQRVRAVKGDTITTVAGTGVAGFGGDGGVAAAGMLNRPTALAIAGGTLYIADTDNQRVRGVTGAVIMTVAGTGVQGLAGDGGAAVLAQLDSPQGLATSGTSLLIADTRNQRVRVVESAGTIQTLTTLSGVPTGRSPRGLAVLSDGNILVADANRNRVETVDAAGVLAVLAGTATQGLSAESTAAKDAELNEPRAVAVDAYGDAVIADTGNARVVVLWNDGLLHVPAAFAAGRVSAMTVMAITSAVYGTGSAPVGVQGLGVARGSVRVIEGQQTVATTTLVSSNGVLSLAALPVGAHALQMIYGGDGINPAASQTMALQVTPAAAVATPDAVGLAYAQPLPALTGSLTGILPQDAGKVAAVFTASAPVMAVPGSYPITATLTGGASGNYAVSTLPASLTITRAGTTIAAATPQSAYSSLPVLLSATVLPAFGGTPTGTVTFYEGGSVLATGTLSGGVATATWTGASAGSHAILAQYGGDGNFLGSSSAVYSSVVTALPDFALSATTTSQQVQGGATATYPFTVTALPAPFTGVVSFRVTGLPADATATFSPVQVVPGGGAAAVTLSIVTPVRGVRVVRPRTYWFAVLLGLPLLRRRWRRGGGLVLLGVVVLGCTDRVAPNTALEATSYDMQVTGTGTNLAGGVVSHSINITLSVR